MDDKYKMQALYFANLPLLDRKYIASVHLEDEDDKLFWNEMLQSVRKGDYFLITHSKSNNGNETRGCVQCLKYRPFLSKRFFIAIDSDVRFPNEEADLDASHYIAQTYAYSWENHYCEAHALQLRFKKAFEAKGFSVTFDFVQFMQQLSPLLFAPYMYVLYHSEAKIKEVFKCLPAQVKRSSLANNGQGLLQEIEQHIANQHLVYSAENATKWTEKLMHLGITPQNVYLHVRGHNLYSMIQSIGTMLCRGTTIAFTTDVLQKDLLPNNAYWQLTKVSGDLSRIIL